MAQAIPNLSVCWKVLLKHRVNWTAVCDAMGELPWRSIWSADNPVERLNVHLSLLAPLVLPGPGNQAAGRFLILSYVYGLLF